MTLRRGDLGLGRHHLEEFCLRRGDGQGWRRVQERGESFELILVFLKPVGPHLWHLCPVKDLLGAGHVWARGWPCLHEVMRALEALPQRGPLGLLAHCPLLLTQLGQSQSS